MRLINTTSLELKDFLGEPANPRFPRYAILSHTWGEGEVTLQDMQNLKVAEKKAGFSKITKCCETALNEGLNWAWVDTCCIDKTSSAELSEAINSMFKWYEYATICYAYLSDVGSTGSDFQTPESCDWGSSRWFTRGWTLQELVAPFEVIIYDREWKQLGTKRRLAKELEKRTRIPEEVLLGLTVRRDISVAARMSWARGRQTTRIEDRAYSLLGLFDINMPLLYGEGNKALSRLHGEILNTIEDDTVFLGGLTGMDGELSVSSSPSFVKTKQDFLAAPDNIFNVFPDTVRPLHGTAGQPMTQPYSYGESSGRWQRNDPMKDPRLRGDVLSMPMRIIQIIFSGRSPVHMPITLKKQFQIEISSVGQRVLEISGRPLCLGMLRCGTDLRLVARYFTCLPVNDELLAYPTPYYRFVSPEEVYYWPYMQCHISVNRGAWNPVPSLKPPRDPAGWDLSSNTQPEIAFGNGWSLNMSLGSLPLYSDETVSSSQLCFEQSNETWNLFLIFRTTALNLPKGVFDITIKLQCSTALESDCHIVNVNHHGREGLVGELCRRMPVLGGFAELVFSIYYGNDSEENYYSPMIRFRAFEASDGEQARTEPKAG